MVRKRKTSIFMAIHIGCINLYHFAEASKEMSFITVHFIIIGKLTISVKVNNQAILSLYFQKDPKGKNVTMSLTTAIFNNTISQITRQRVIAAHEKGTQ